jgi:hypothetical protein
MPTYSDTALKAQIDAARNGSPDAVWTGPELETVLKNIIDSKTGSPLTDLTLVVGRGTTYDPEPGTDTIALPAEWHNKRIRVQLGGPTLLSRFAAYTRTNATLPTTTNGLTLTGGNAFESGQYIIIENY